MYRRQSDAEHVLCVCTGDRVMQNTCCVYRRQSDAEHVLCVQETE